MTQSWIIARMGEGSSLDWTRRELADGTVALKAIGLRAGCRILAATEGHGMRLESACYDYVLGAGLFQESVFTGK